MEKNGKKSKLTLIPVELAQQMVNAYDKQRREPAAAQRSRELGKKVEEPRSFWVSKAALLELMSLNDADGIRFYYAIADDYPGFELKKQEYKKAHTVVMVATKSGDPDNPTMENSVDCLNIPGAQPAAHASDGKIGTVVLPIAPSQAGLPADDVDLCPPPSPPGQRL
ncbi:hypothetical protein SAMN05421747_10474 [Parapedobacter composti]|uniref:Uncharacterized protein n=1 Tax=Parapedobacter composti TaxID=623281 RepID=A0A1I1GFQ7_9SPHI|nr:hypothetical protein [Parapedobacter composti]SFC08678.1 hypothetical protein SAMN05421747_10474 [Parapedobacter composti]